MSVTIDMTDMIPVEDVRAIAAGASRHKIDGLVKKLPDELKARDRGRGLSIGGGDGDGLYVAKGVVQQWIDQRTITLRADEEKFRVSGPGYRNDTRTVGDFLEQHQLTRKAES